jgi:release factor glutamine methyltransferase
VALDGGKDGLDFYRRLVEEAGRLLRTTGVLVMEIGFGQRRALETMFAQSHFLKIKYIFRDYRGIDRILIAHNA